MAVDLFSLRMNIETSGLGQAKADLTGLETSGRAAALSMTNFTNAWTAASANLTGPAAEIAAFNTHFSAGFFNEKMVAGMSLAGQEAAAAGVGAQKWAAGMAALRAQREAAIPQETFLSGLINSQIARFLTVTAVIGGVASAYRSATGAADALSRSNVALDGTAKMTGTSLAALQAISAEGQRSFRLSAIQANELAVEMAKLARKARDVGQAGPALAACLDIGAARGMSAEQTLIAVHQAILGIDEGTDKLFNKNPSVIYKEFAESIGTTAGKLTDQQKAQALLNEAMTSGEKVRGSYAQWLETTAGRSQQLATQWERLAMGVGSLIAPFRDVGLAVTSWLTEGLINLVNRWNMALQETGLIVRRIGVFVGLASPPPMPGVESGSSTTATGQTPPAPSVVSPQDAADIHRLAGKAAADHVKAMLAVLDPMAPDTLP